MAAPASRSGYVRWLICALLFLAATINYVDRQVIGILKTTLQHDFGWSEVDYADIIFAFQLAYAIGFVVAGRVIDRIGTRLGFAAAIVVWSLAAIGHAEAPRFGPAAALGWARIKGQTDMTGVVPASGSNLVSTLGLRAQAEGPGSSVIRLFGYVEGGFTLLGLDAIVFDQPATGVSGPYLMLAAGVRFGPAQ